MSEQDESKTNPNQESTDEQKGKEDTQKTFTQDELEKTLSERLKREREKSEKQVAERLKKEREDWERQAQLSQEEKEAEARKRQQEETQAREREITLRENRAEARELLQERNISTSLVDFVVDLDSEKTKENIANLEKTFLQAVEAGVNDRLKGQTPTEKSTQNTQKQNAPRVF